MQAKHEIPLKTQTSAPHVALNVPNTCKHDMETLSRLRFKPPFLLPWPLYSLGGVTGRVLEPVQATPVLKPGPVKEPGELHLKRCHLLGAVHDLQEALLGILKALVQDGHHLPHHLHYHVVVEQAATQHHVTT